MNTPTKEEEELIFLRNKIIDILEGYSLEVLRDNHNNLKYLYAGRILKVINTHL